MPEIETCRPEQLEAFLCGELSASEERLLTAHLEKCEACRRHLDVVAAPADGWSRASAFLKDDSLDRTALSGTEFKAGESDSSMLHGSDDDLSAIEPQIHQVLEVLNASDDPNMLGRLGSYEVTGVVGAGGMGVVLKALDGPLDRTVAIKVMAPYLASSGAARQRFAREARAAAAVIHPNVIAIHGVATDATLPYLVMPYVGGSSLQKRLDREGALPVGDVLRIGIQIASGLAAAHQQGLVHRDIKPANILLDQGVDRLVITDFGLARTVDDASVTRTGVIAGTPQYMSPEQACGEPVDARSDLFSMGSVLYAACTGRVPFRAETPYGVLRRITDHAPRPIREVNPLIPEWLCRVIERLHAKSAADRYQSADEVARLLTECLAHVTAPTVHALPVELRSPKRFFTAKGSQRMKLFAVGGLACAAIGIALAWATLWPRTADDLRQASNASINAVDTPVSERGASGNFLGEPSLPWNAPENSSSWDDQLTPVFQHIEQSLLQDAFLSSGN